MNAARKAKALATIDGMAEINDAEMMHPGTYVTDVVRPERKHAICGGREACLIGSMFLAYGVRAGEAETYSPAGALRRDYLDRHPDLGVVYDVLNEVAGEILVKRGYGATGTPHRDVLGNAEYLFENAGADQDDVAELLAGARRRIEAT